MTSPIDNAISLQVVDSQCSDLNQVVQEVLELHLSCFLDFQTTLDLSALPVSFEKQGFLTLQLTDENLLQRLQEGSQVITARYQGQLIAYLLLSNSDRFFKWLSTIKHELDVDAYRDKPIKVLTQIAVTSSFSKQGIGKQLVDYAKKLAPQGLLTTILYKPFTNLASLAFFAKQGFVHLASAYSPYSPYSPVEASGVDSHFLKEIYIEFWEPLSSLSLPL